MICPFCDNYIPSADIVGSRFLSAIPVHNGICRGHRPFIIGVMNESHDGHYGYWIAAQGTQILVNIGEEVTVVNNFKSTHCRCGKKYAKKKFPLLYRDGWCYASPFYEKRMYTINYMMDVSPESFNDILKKIERLKAFL